MVRNAARDLLLDLDDQPLTEVAAGISTKSAVVGFALDSITNPAITSSKRLAVAAPDLEEVRAASGEVEQLSELWLHDPATQTAAFKHGYLDSGLPRAGQMVASAIFRVFTIIGDGMVSAVVGAQDRLDVQAELRGLLPAGVRRLQLRGVHPRHLPAPHARHATGGRGAVHGPGLR